MQPQTMRFFLFSLLTLLTLGGCGLFTPDSNSLLEPTDAAPHESDFEMLVASAIRKAVVVDKDIPDYQLIDDKSKIIVSNRTSEGESVTRGALPEGGSVEFVLISPEDIQKLADDEGDFVYLHIGEVEIEGEAATVSISTTWAVAEDSEVTYLSGGGYQLQYKNADGKWSFEKILMMWIS